MADEPLTVPTIALAPAPAGDIVFWTDHERGWIIRFKPDGRIERGPGFASDDAASVAFVDVLSRYMASWMVEMRQRAEKAELALLDAQRKP